MRSWYCFGDNVYRDYVCIALSSHLAVALCSCCGTDKRGRSSRSSMQVHYHVTRHSCHRESFEDYGQYGLLWHSLEPFALPYRFTSLLQFDTYFVFVMLLCRNELLACFQMRLANILFAPLPSSQPQGRFQLRSSKWPTQSKSHPNALR